MNGTSWDERVSRLADFNMFKSEIKTLLFYVIFIISMISRLTDYNSMVILKTFIFMSHYIDRICIVFTIITYGISFL